MKGTPSLTFILSLITSFAAYIRAKDVYHYIKQDEYPIKPSKTLQRAVPVEDWPVFSSNWHNISLKTSICSSDAPMIYYLTIKQFIKNH